MKYKVKFAKFVTIEIEAESKEEAEDKAAVMEDEEVEAIAGNNHEMAIWDIGLNKEDA